MWGDKVLMEGDKVMVGFPHLGKPLELISTFICFTKQKNAI